MTEDDAPYETPSLRLLMLMIQHGPPFHVEVAWEKQKPDGSWSVMHYNSVRTPLPGHLFQALHRLVPHALALCGLPVDIPGPGFEVAVIKMRYDANGEQSACIMMFRPSTGTVFADTPFLATSVQSPEYHQALRAAEAEALQFAADVCE